MLSATTVVVDGCTMILTIVITLSSTHIYLKLKTPRHMNLHLAVPWPSVYEYCVHIIVNDKNTYGILMCG